VVNGSFELQNFHAGAYSLALRVADAQPAIVLASAVLNVNADVDGIVFSLGEGATLFRPSRRAEHNSPSKTP